MAIRVVLFFLSALVDLHRCILCCLVFFFFFKQKTAYEMRISDWSSDVCSSDLSGAVSLRRLCGERESQVTRRGVNLPQPRPRAGRGPGILSGSNCHAHSPPLVKPTCSNPALR